MPWDMTSLRRVAAPLTLALILAACSGASAESGPPISRALSPPLEVAEETTTTTKALPTPAEADRLAQAEVRTVLTAAHELFAGSGTFNAELGAVAALAGVGVVSLDQAALQQGVVYDAHGPRLTLHRQSLSGRWFCVDVTDKGADHGFGDTFPDALAACTDGVVLDGWREVFSPTGTDEAAIKALAGSLAAALEAGDVEAAHAAFSPETACTPASLRDSWPGIPLLGPDQFDVESISVEGDTATARLLLGPFSDLEWRLDKMEGGWFIALEPCLLFGPEAARQANTSAREILEQALFEVRTAFVAQENLAFTSADLAELNGDLQWVELAEVGYGTLAYSGSEGLGLLVTGMGAGRFLCAVESLSAETVYGEGETVTDVDSVGKCRSRATS